MRGGSLVDVLGGALEVLDLPGSEELPALVLLHEGLGSVGLWRDLPGALHSATGARTVAYSRFGHGRSSAPPTPRTPAFMHEEAREVLPAALAELQIERPILLGHSDGASIALIHAAEQDVAGVVAMAPHAFVEEVCVRAIAQTREAFRRSGLRERMARHHDDPDVTFSGWADVWLDSAFRDWNITQDIAPIAAPVLLIQGRQDEYGTLAQLDAIQSAVAGPVIRLVVEGGHSPHLEQPQQVLSAIADFVLTRAAPTPTPRAA